MDEPLITDIPLIRRYARHNEAEDWRFRTFMKGRLNLSNDKLDAIVEEITDDVWSKIDCTTCGNCCKTLQIVVDKDDIKRLAPKLGLTPAKFEAEYVTANEFRDMCFKSSPCRFLGDDNRCTVYEHRPKACRDFPYLRDRNFRSRSMMMIEKTAICPIVFNVFQRIKRRFWPVKAR